ncbi:MAG: sigma-70 family RNA polymerase sigma factor [Planctomycetota bacterium]
MAMTHSKSAVGPGEANTAAALKPAESVLAKLAAEDRERLNGVLIGPVEYMPHPSFGNAGTPKKLFGDELGEKRAARPWCNSSDVRLTEDTSASPIATLTTEQEQHVFLRLNYARYRMAELLVQFAGRHLTSRAAREILWWHGRAVAAKCRIVQANVPLVLAMAKRTRLGGLDYADLISEGNMALLRSVDKFDCGRGFKFSTYACRAILKSFSRVAMRTSRYRGRFPTEFDPTLERSHYQEEVREGHEAACVDELRGIMSHNTAQLNDVEVKVIQARFALCHVEGLEDGGPKTLEQVGMLIGVTKERVRQIQNKALAKLRTKLEDDFLAA